MISFRQAGATAIPLRYGIASPLAVGDKVGLDAAVSPVPAANSVNGPFRFSKNGVSSRACVEILAPYQAKRISLKF
jgi:hypothetical protein